MLWLCIYLSLSSPPTHYRTVLEGHQYPVGVKIASLEPTTEFWGKPILDCCSSFTTGSAMLLRSWFLYVTIIPIVPPKLIDGFKIGFLVMRPWDLFGFYRNSWLSGVRIFSFCLRTPWGVTWPRFISCLGVMTWDFPGGTWNVVVVRFILADWF